ncbi:uncharacterized protein At3g49140 isoform X1 [Primulina tabacum]|uniref:uncharacterized protein At3g49140 isoform X1 n=1 Tax=Primulina tabacum TaxID=48773 RepID=UPI003F5AB1FA
MLIVDPLLSSSYSPSMSVGSFPCLRCLAVPIGCSTSYGFPNGWIIKSSVSEYSGLSFRIKNPFIGATQINWFHRGLDICISQVSVAADYSDSVPGSSSYVTDSAHHPLEELKESSRAHDTMPTSAEIARTAVEANSMALLIFPGVVHCEPHENISWIDSRYVVDEFGDIYFEIYDDQNILQDPGASNPVTALIGMDLSHYESRKVDVFYDNFLEIDSVDDISFADDYFQVENFDTWDIDVDWGTPVNSTWIHPVYFSKCLTKAADNEHYKMMDYPSNCVSVWGLFRPTFTEEEGYLRRLFKDRDSLSFTSRDHGSCCGSMIYRLDITKIELFSVYGIQALVSLHDFQYADPDALVHSAPSIIERFVESGAKCNVALKALCKKKGLNIEGANLIGVDSLGMDVRVSSGTEVRTHRFPFKVKAMSECAAEKRIQQLLYPRSRRKKWAVRRRDVDLF